MAEGKLVMVSYSELLKYISENNLKKNEDGWDDRWIDSNGDIKAMSFHGDSYNPCYIWKELK